MIFSSGKAWVHLFIRIWADKIGVQYELEIKKTFSTSELVLELPENVMPEEDWIEEAIENIEIEYFLPEKFEICEEPIFYEVIGIFTAKGSKDYWGEYDEDYDFIIKDWTCSLDSNFDISYKLTKIKI